MMKDAAGSIKDSFSGLFSGGIGGGLAALGIGFSADKLSQSARASMDLAEHIKTLSEELGVSTDFFQQWAIAAQHSASTSEQAQKGLEHFVETIGKARSGNTEAIATLKKWDVSLSDASGTAYSSQEVFDEAAKKILSIEDPAQRAAAAVDLMGKKGEQLISALQNLESVKSEKGFILSKRELDVLDAGNQKVESLWQKVKTLTAKGWAGVLTPITEMDAMRAALEGKNKPGAPTVTDASVSQAKDYANAQDDVRRAELDKKYAGGDAQEMFRKAMEEQGIAQDKFNTAQDGTIEKLKAQKELIEAQARTKAAEMAAEKESQDKKDKADQKARDSAKQRGDLSKQLLEDQKKLSHLQLESAPGAQNRQYGTLQEVANSGYAYFRGNAWRWQDGPYADMARQAMDLDARAHQERIFGNIGGAKRDESRSEELKRALESAEVIAPSITDHLKEVREQMSNLNDNVQSVTDQLKRIITDGING